MLMTKRKPATVGEILVEEFMKPLGLTQGALAEAMGVQRKHVNELCNGRRNVTAATALILARVFGNSPDFWLNAQRRTCGRRCTIRGSGNGSSGRGCRSESLIAAFR
jgi:addiction module HigA family antidote